MTMWRDRATLHRGDYRETLALCEGKVDLVACSPPFADARSYGANVAWDMTDYATLGDAVYGALRPGGWALVNVDAPVREWREGMGTERGFHPLLLTLDWAYRVGFRVPDRLHFGRNGIPGAYEGRFRNDVEPLLWFQKPGGESYFDKSALVEKGTSGAYSGAVGRNHDADKVVVRAFTGRAAEEGLRNRGTLWGYGSVGNGHTGAPDIESADHPARWPYKIAEDIVRCFCPPDGTVCDPFVGAGTTLVAALEHGRKAIVGDLLCRPADGKPWIDVAANVADARFRQARLFAPGAA